MTLGKADNQGDLLDDVTRFCGEALPERSIYSFLRRERDRLFPDQAFSDLFENRGRCSVPPSVVAVVMVLQRLEGLSDREAVERYCFDNRWRYAAGVGGYDTSGWASFSHTVLVDMRERLRRSKNPDRIFEAALGAAREAGLIGHKRALDSTPLYDAVATMDTVTLIRSAIRGLLKAADAELAAELAGVLTSGDGYTSAAKPQIDWDDEAAREMLIDTRVKDAYACLALLDGRELDPVVEKAAQLVATVVGQDLEAGDDGLFRIVGKVAKDRVISLVDPEARHGHKTQARGFDGYKGHVATDPDSEIVTATTVTPGNAGDASVAEDLIEDLLGDDGDRPGRRAPHAEHRATDPDVVDHGDSAGDEEVPTVYGDNAYGTGSFQERLENEGIDSRCKTQVPVAANGMFPKDRFEIDLDADTVTCPAGVTVTVHRRANGKGAQARFAEHCASCPMRSRCTRATEGRTVNIGAYEASLRRARERQQKTEWRDDYRSTRPKVERKLAHLMRRKHGGRRARVRGRAKVNADFRLLAAAANLARLSVLGVRSTGSGWTVAEA
jgi:IS5 family transposase/transposase